MRIISGEFRGRKLFAPAGLDTRPTSDRVKEALFNIIKDRLYQASVLDLFAGSGALGLEALSRGAEKAFFVDNSPKAIEAITRNAEPLSLGNRIRIIKADPTRPVKSLYGIQADLLFLDPPYGLKLEEKAMSNALNQGWIRQDALAVLEHSRKDAPRPEGFDLIQERRYGRTILSFFQPSRDHEID